MYTLSLAMMVKNEAASLAASLRCLRFVDHLYLLDTGSTDGTAGEARRMAEEAGKSITIYRGEFVDFATSRNLLLDSIGTESTYLLLLDADDVLTDESMVPLVNFVTCASFHALNKHEDAWLLRVKAGHTSFMSARLLRTASGARYVGKVHEHLDVPTDKVGVIRDYRVTILHETKSEESSLFRLLRDVEVLKEDSSPRGVFYYAETLRALGRREDAIVAYRQRVNLSLGERDEEVFASYMALASLCADKEVYLKFAYRFFPHRQEPLCALAELALKNGDPSMAFVYAFAAYHLPYPHGDNLFIDESVYEHRTATALAQACAKIGPRDGSKWNLGMRMANVVASVRPEAVETQMLLVSFQMDNNQCPTDRFSPATSTPPTTSGETVPRPTGSSGSSSVTCESSRSLPSPTEDHHAS